MSDTLKLKSRISTLNHLLDDLDSQLDPLLAQSLPESLLQLDTIQQAKLQVTVPYLVYDLIIIYLKTNGIDPRTHPVFTELERVRQYIEKISNAENPETRRTTVDKATANRFIKHAIAQVKTQQQQDLDASGPAEAAEASTSTVQIPVKITSKMLARAQYEQELKEAASDEENEELEVFDEKGADEAFENADPKGKGKASEIARGDAESHPLRKRRRLAVDPFAGYGDSSAPVTETSSSSKRKKRKNGDHSEAQAGTDDMSTPSPRKIQKRKASVKRKSVSGTSG